MIVKKVIRKLIWKLFQIFLFWVLVSTVVPSLVVKYTDFSYVQQGSYYAKHTSLYTLNGPQVIHSNLTNTNILVVIAHPDDEVMFFAPSILELSKPDYGNTVIMLCFSSGNAEGLGDIRTAEVIRSGQILGIKEVKVIDDPAFQDGMNIIWDASKIAQEISGYVSSLQMDSKSLSILTFDEFGISGHPNHISMYNGCLEFAKLSKEKVSVWTLRTWPLYQKYSGFLLSMLEISQRLYLNFGWVRYCGKAESLYARAADIDSVNWVLGQLRSLTEKPFKDPPKTSINIFSDINSMILGIGDMVFGHYSQIVWFRWFWLFSSKYANSNELVLVSN
ncbi:unnamed protein product [Kuraishia capsulata CBS 1993]|uniref:N-acetylglucosaminylphosphatidylinositol deacetylase n=1 Tax=Kuraishia capsulata CBS 1993 TaxID=1382522 RepID=W6MIE9_9ASCO|nr:uncharacterized protein KUCA_T00001892001 [Kuraishia capsulata CBS 1993]CDK25921.1 unnamed protein product [Kuraishia capsulata CBS 1993]